MIPTINGKVNYMKENNNVNSKLIMQDLVFSQMSYELKKKTKDTEFKTSISVKYAEKKR